MEMRKVFDSKGSWFVSQAQFPFVDPTNGCRFEPGVPTQTTQTEWMKDQPMIKVWKDPEAPAEKPAAAPVKA